MSSPSSSTAADASPAVATTPSPPSSEGTHSVRRQLETNRFVNQARRRAWEAAKEESIGVCHEFISDFVRCSEGRTFSVIWACKPHNAWMTKCMKTYMENKDTAAALAAGAEMKAQYEQSQH